MSVDGLDCTASIKKLSKVLDITTKMQSRMKVGAVHSTPSLIMRMRSFFIRRQRCQIEPHVERTYLAFYDEAPSLAIVYNWFNEFKQGRTNLTDDLHDGRPSTATTEDVSAVRLMIETGKRVITSRSGQA
ncbi:hypothetical protein EVAR_62709_1 [Eumeta japonica]|uniref:Mos1 transposase HTH domain-containing protein n=1 Tax=Eumeta variegata TaxID=151549 RepID=A0A4C1Z0S0_EUMVA|nr:hypothetical protein EVAR_62709_1 [Eumeta japonica]